MKSKTKTGFTPFEAVVRPGRNKRLRTGFTPLEIKRRRRLTVACGNLSLTGFTLIEVLLAAGISALTLISAYSALRLGWISYKRMNNNSQAYQDLRNGLEKFAKELRNSFVFQAKDDNYKIHFSGKQREMSFSSLVPTRNKDGKTYTVLSKIFYKFEDNNLLRACLKEKDILIISAEPEYEVFLSNLAAVDFYYGKKSSLQELSWEESFDDKDTLPFAVRMKLTQKTDNLSAQPFTKSVILRRPDEGA